MIAIVKKILHKLYTIGKAEDDRRAAVNRHEVLKAVSVIGESSVLADDCLVENGTGDRSKIKIGRACIVRGYLLVFNHGGQLTIGDNCFIGPDTRIWSAASIEIGSRVLISHNVNIHDSNSHPLNAAARHNDFVNIFNSGLPRQNNLLERPIKVGDDVWIGFNSTILKGVTIGKGAIIGACTLITEDVPEFAIVVGNPAKIVRYTD